MNLTIIVPTHANRTHYLKRMLSFYDDLKFSGKILIGDSSEEPILSNNRMLLDNCSNLDVKHIHYPKSKYSNAGKLAKDIGKLIETDYVCFSGDDDFQIPKTLEICINFLNYNLDYISAHGSKIKYNLLTERETGKVKIDNVNIVKGQYMAVPDPLFRFRVYMRSETSTQYHVMRKSVWEEMYRYSFSLPNSYFLVSEVLPCSLYSIAGKVKRFDDIIQYLMEQTLVSYQSENKDYIIQGINSPEWGECVMDIKDIIVETLESKGVSKVDSERAFDEEFNFRVLRLFHDQFFKKYKETFEEFNQSYTAHLEKWDQVREFPESTVKDSMNLAAPYLIKFMEKYG